MKTLIFALLLSVSAQAQQLKDIQSQVNAIDLRMKVAGGELMAYKRTYYGGLAAQIAGAAIMGAAIKSKNDAVLYGGSMLFLSGTITVTLSHRHINRAGKALRKN